ncbi:hypothetical protein [Streptomyces sp. Tue6028]|uniref:hypothetical protein n=1 Tax=Streptomyces sp. Tue6028 TaxID=2036037 RepID=UPI00117D1852|nr:hypothetical protein [Streptomyces sp. Tue6028]
MRPAEEPILARRGLRIDLTPRELHLAIVGIGGAALAMWVGAEPLTVLPLAFLVAVRVRIHRI